MKQEHIKEFIYKLTVVLQMSKVYLRCLIFHRAGERISFLPFSRFFHSIPALGQLRNQTLPGCYHLFVSISRNAVLALINS